MAVTEFNDSSHYGFFLTGTTLTSSTGKYARLSELVLSALRAQGVLDDMEDGTTAPVDTTKLWLDKNTDPAVLKEYDSIGSAWVAMTRDRMFGRAIATELTNVGGTANAITVDEPDPFIDGRMYFITPTADNTGATTIQVTGVGTYNVLTPNGSAVGSGTMITGNATVMLFTGGAFKVLFSPTIDAVLVDSSVTTAKIADGAVTIDKNAIQYSTISEAEAATIPAVMKRINLLGRASVTDDGWGYWDRMSLADITSAGYPSAAYFRSTDRYMPDGSTDNTNGGYWVIAPMMPVRAAALGVSASSSDNTAAMQAAFDVARIFGHNWTQLPHGQLTVDGGKFTWDDTQNGVRIDGATQGNPGTGTVISVTGTPTKVVCTRENHVAAYDSGSSFDMEDYSDSTDDAIAWLFKFGGYYCQMNNLAIYNSWADVDDLDDWGAEYDASVVVQGRYFTMNNVRIAGVWERAALLEDWTQWGKSTDQMVLKQCHFEGRWGYESMGPKASGAMHANDDRGAGGNSDMSAFGCRFYSVRRNSPSAGGFVRYPAPLVGGVDHAGAMKRSGRAPNTAGLGQGHRYFNCRFHSTSRYPVLLDFDSRTEFFGCRFEIQAGYESDGTTPLDGTNTSGSDFRIEFTANSTRTRVYGGEASGIWLQDDQPNLLGIASGADYYGGGSRWFGSEVNTRAAEDFKSQTSGTWTPVMYGGGTAGSPTGTFTGYFVRNGIHMTCWFELTLTNKGGATGAVRVDGLPLNAYLIRGQANINAFHGMTLTANVVSVGAVVEVGSNELSLFRNYNNGTGYANLDWSELANTSVIRGSVTYISEF